MATKLKGDFEMNYGTCEHCGTTEYLEGDLFEIYTPDRLPARDYSIVCRDCVGEFEEEGVICNDCSEELNSDSWGDSFEITFIGETFRLCGDCYDNYFLCEECTRWQYDPWGDYQYHCECHQETRCEDCFFDHDQESEGGIHPYRHKPEAIFHNDSGHTDYTAKSGTIYYGVELETQAGLYNSVYSGDDIPALVGTLVEEGGERDAYLKEDGSISGVEIVTHPATLAHHVNIFPWDDIVTACEEDDLYTDDHAGLHIHASKAGFGETRSEIAQVETNLLAVLEVHWDKWIELARGENPEYAPRNCNWDSYDDPLTEEKLERGKSIGHFSALNLENYATAELRLNRSTLDVSEIKACIQGFDTMISLAKTLDLNAILRLTWSDVTKHAWKLGHLELIEFFTTWDTSKLTPQY